MDEQHIMSTRTSDQGQVSTGIEVPRSTSEKEAGNWSTEKGKAVIMEESTSRSVVDVPFEILKEVST